MEPRHNIGFLCPNHAPKPQEKYAKLPPDWFVGKFVKKGFHAMTPNGKESFEHMWAKVLGVQGKKMRARLDNDPIYQTDLQAGDIVLISPEEVEDVLE